MGKIKGKVSVPWKIGERVATPNGFIATIVGLTDERALIRNLSGSGETELPLGLVSAVKCTESRSTTHWRPTEEEH